MVNGADHLLCLDSVPVEVSGRLQVLETGDLLIAAVRESDAGRYSCVRANEAGQVSAAGYLSVLGMSTNLLGVQKKQSCKKGVNVVLT